MVVLALNIEWNRMIWTCQKEKIRIDTSAHLTASRLFLFLKVCDIFRFYNQSKSYGIHGLN